MLPDAVDLLDERSREAYVGVLIHVAAADGDLVREESAAIEAAMGRAMIRPKRREQLRPQLTEKNDLGELLEQLSDDAKKVVLRDAMIVAAVDGDYQKSELKVLKEIAKSGGVGKDELRALFAWVEDGWRWMARGRDLLGVNLAGDKSLLD
ncbi:MAG: TerB family tellurite resistance protein [Candidatus Thermoplasmatota archaeon]|nr:TerB family tellurite resistance protein [Candidatus Thermoplasmatota archaeon]